MRTVNKFACRANVVQTRKKDACGAGGELLNNIQTIWDAARAGDVAQIEESLRRPWARYWVNTREPGKGFLPLGLAALHGKASAVEFLLDHGASVDLRDKLGNTALLSAAIGGYRQIIQVLIDRGADVNAQNNNGDTALMMASKNGHVEVVQQLLDAHADINARNNKGNTALYLASQSGHLWVVLILLNHYADVNAQNNNGDTALHVASREGYVGIVKLLLDEYEINLEAQNSEGNTALHLAAVMGDADVAKALLERGANPQIYNWRDQTPVDLALQKLRAKNPEERENYEMVIGLLVKFLYQRGGAIV